MGDYPLSFTQKSSQQSKTVNFGAKLYKAFKVSEIATSEMISISSVGKPSLEHKHKVCKSGEIERVGKYWFHIEISAWNLLKFVI